MKLACPECAQHIECDSGYGGTEIQCPACTALMLVPLPEAETSPTTGATPALNIDHSRAELQGFDAYYRREIEPYMAGRQEHQRSVRRFAIWAGVLGTLLTALAGWFTVYAWSWSENTAMFSGVVTIVLMVATPAAIWWKLDDLQAAVKGFLLLEVCRFFDIINTLQLTLKTRI